MCAGEPNGRPNLGDLIAMAWKKGESGNPSGKKPGTLGGRNKLISDRLRVHLLRPFAGADDDAEMTNADKIAENLVHAAAHDSNLQAIVVILDRLEGKPVQDQNVSINDNLDYRNIREWTLDELDREIARVRAELGRETEKGNGNGSAEPGSVSLSNYPG